MRYTLREDAPLYPHCHFEFVTIHHLLNGYLVLTYLYTIEYKSSLLTLRNVIVETAHKANFTILNRAGFCSQI